MYLLGMSGLFGIMADSHGDAMAIFRAVRRLKDLGCESLVHLGDVCESSRPETADECVSLLREHEVATVKGNNDHIVVANREGSELTDVSAETVAWLKALPLKIRRHGAAFVHSLPFVRELGLSAMVRGMGKKEMTFYLSFPHSEKILFRGHNHKPRAVLMENGRLVERRVESQGLLDLSQNSNVIVTCGALMNGLCMLWDSAGRTVSSISL
jgi:predicted phosphodiesterase